MVGSVGFPTASMKQDIRTELRSMEEEMKVRKR